jgi:hypothetical protein
LSDLQLDKRFVTGPIGDSTMNESDKPLINAIVTHLMDELGTSVGCFCDQDESTGCSIENGDGGWRW